jgi:hypothetical protein
LRPTFLYLLFLLDILGWRVYPVRNPGKRRHAMGDKGKKDKDKGRKQKINKQEQKAKDKIAKQPKRTF